MASAIKAERLTGTSGPSHGAKGAPDAESSRAQPDSGGNGDTALNTTQRRLSRGVTETTNIPPQREIHQQQDSAEAEVPVNLARQPSRIREAITRVQQSIRTPTRRREVSHSLQCYPGAMACRFFYVLGLCMIGSGSQIMMTAVGLTTIAFYLQGNVPIIHVELLNRTIIADGCGENTKPGRTSGQILQGERLRGEIFASGYADYDQLYHTFKVLTPILLFFGFILLALGAAIATAAWSKEKNEFMHSMRVLDNISGVMQQLVLQASPTPTETSFRPGNGPSRVNYVSGPPPYPNRDSAPPAYEAYTNALAVIPDESEPSQQSEATTGTPESHSARSTTTDTNVTDRMTSHGTPTRRRSIDPGEGTSHRRRSSTLNDGSWKSAGYLKELMTSSAKSKPSSSGKGHKSKRKSVTDTRRWTDSDDEDDVPHPRRR